MSILSDALEIILSRIESDGDELGIELASLQLGLTRAEIDSLTQQLPFQLPSEVYELYQWANGAWPREEFEVMLFD
ncbi:MAG: hypothetical protein AAGF24_13855, partial [Cyanobacteria bacterium P01_H01_bin.121]